ncbi:MAG: nucleotidyltransferase family protein [Clostridia bacterium]|nr:nucleotidyltransferase family protein [Clostridia bacterium]
MYKNIRYLLDIVKYALGGEKCEVPADTDWKEIVKIANTQGLIGMVTHVIGEIDAPDMVKEFLEAHRMKMVFKETNQEVLVAGILEDFEKEGIKAMPMKGYILKNLYPESEMREMVDVDILIDQSQYEEIKPIMEQNGFTFDKESAHEYIFIRLPAVAVELHKSIVPNYNTELYDYYGDGWKFAKKKPGYENIYELSKEDFYIYTLVHAAKHYIGSGIGMRHVVDMWVLKEAYMPEMDNEYLDAELEKLGLTKFNKMMCDLADVWFGSGEMYDELKYMEEFILGGGVLGTKERADASEIYRNSVEKNYTEVKRESIKTLIFPKLSVLKEKYKILEKLPFLYPFAIVWRGIAAIFAKKVTKEIGKRTVGSKELDDFAMHCEIAGLRKTL